MGPERSKPLHNFSMGLKWGHQRFLRCVKVAPDEPPPLHHRRSSQPDNNQPDPFHGSKRKATSNSDIDNLNNIDAVREKLMVDLRVATDKLKVSIFEEGGVANTNNPTRPWNLRTRRAACKAPPPPPQEQQQQQHKNLDSVPEAVVGVAKENPKTVVQKKMMDERPKFSVSLSKAEMEQDFWALVGTRPPRRPKKRPRIVQRQLDVR